MPRGGARPGAGRQLGSKNKATIQREHVAAQQAASARREGHELAIATLERQMKIAESMCTRNARITPEEAAAMQASGNARAQPQEGDQKLFGEWFDRWSSCSKELAKYQSPQIKSVDAPAPPPDPDAEPDQPRRRFALRVFEGGRALKPNDAA